MMYGVSGGNSYGGASFDYGHGSDSYVAARSGAYAQGTAAAAYDNKSAYLDAGYSPATMHSSFIAETFLAENRPWTPIVSNMNEVREVVEETYQKMTGEKFPHKSIKVQIMEEKQFRMLQHQMQMTQSKGVVGFSLNRYGKGTSEIYVKQDHKDSVLLTIGHEIGHVLSKTLPNPKDEEAKAHAFSIAWMETIRDNNIGNLQPNILLNPAKNGLHDEAYAFVKYLMKTGATAHDVFKTLAHGLTSIISSD